jgi:hypothetical protein
MGKKVCTEQTCWNLLRSINLSSGGLFYPEEGGSKFLRSTCKYIHTRRWYICRSGKLTMCGRNSEDCVNCGLCCVSCVWLCCSSDRRRLNGQVPAAASSTDTDFAWKVAPISFFFYLYRRRQYKGIT